MLCLICSLYISIGFTQEELEHPDRKSPVDTLWEINSEIIYISSQSNRKTFPVSMIQSSSIERANLISFQPLLNRKAGIRMESGALNTNRISIRGVGNREPFATSKLKAYLDEIPLTSGVGESTIEDIDPSMISSISLWKNPASAIWGAGLGGMLHLKTIEKIHPAYMGSIQMGSFGLIKTNHHWFQNWDENGKAPFALQMGYLQNKGYRENNTYRRFSTALLQKLELSKKLYFKLFTQWIGLKAEIPSSLGYTDFKLNPQMAASNWAGVNGREDYGKFLIGVSHNYILNSKLNWKGSVFHNFFKNDEIRPFNILHEKNQNLGFRQKMHWMPNHYLDVQLGFEYFHERYQWRTWEEEMPELLLVNFKEDRDYLNTFCNVQLTFSPFSIYAGSNLNFTHFSIADLKDINRKNSKHYDPVFSPMLALSADIIPRRLGAMLGVSKGFSPVTIGNSIGSDGNYNPELKPETGVSLDLGLYYTKGFGQIKLDLYRMVVDDLILRKRISEEEYTVRNGGKTLHQGLELESSLNLGPNLYYRTGLEWIDHRFKSFIDEGSDYSGNRLTGSSNLKIWQQVEYNILPYFNASISFEYLGKAPLNDANSLYSEPYTLVKFQGEYLLSLNDHEFKIGTHINNIFNRKYASMHRINAVGFGNAEPRYYYPGLPRHFDIYLKFRFQRMPKNSGLTDIN